MIDTHVAGVPGIRSRSALVPLESVLCTEELTRRPARAPDHAKENRALVALAQALADSPQTILQTLAETILEVLGAGSSGISLLSDDEQSFFWPAVAGAWQPQIGGGTPRDFGPCGDVLDGDAPLLFRRLDRRYDYFASTASAPHEALLVPFYRAEKAVGTIWAVAHDERHQFDAEDLRLLVSLGAFASAAYQSHVTETTLRRGENELRDFIENAAVGLQWVGPNGIILWANQTELDLIGCTREEYVGRNITEFYADPPVIADILARLTGGETLHDHAARLRCKDGSIRHVLTSSNAYFEAGKFVHTRCFTRDITERKLADAASREIESFNRSIIDSSPDCIKVLDLDGNLLSMHNGQALLGIKDIRPFLNKSWIEFWEGDDRRAAQAAVGAAAASEEGRFVGFFRTLRGEPKWWDVKISSILDTNGKPVRLLAVSRDVTERRQKELNLEFLASVSLDLVQWTNVDEMMQTVVAKTAAYLHLSNCAFAEIDEAAEQVVIHHDWHREDVPSLIGVHRLADFVEGEFMRTAHAGETIVVRDVAADPRTDVEKFAALKIASFICVPLIRDAQWRFALCLYRSAAYDWREDEIELARELTGRVWARLERLRTEAALRQSEERYRYLFNSIDEGFCVVDLIFDADEKAVDYRFLEVNPSFEMQTGIRDALGKRIREFAPHLEPSWFERYGAVALTGEPVRFVNESKDLNRWFDVYAFRIGGPGSRKVAIIFNNVTARTKAEKALREFAETLVELDRRKDEFLAMLGHELRNPLAPISNAVHLLRLQKNEDPIQQQARGVIERQVGQLKHLVDDLMEVSRINTGRVRLRQERIVISGIVERAVETAHPLIVQHRHELTVTLPTDPVWLHADAARLEQVVVNLLTNAAKYTDDGGRIWLSVEQASDATVLRVRDSGIGISPELLPRIFDLFTQAERSLDRSQGGLGIGLCLVQRLVELHGGTVEANSVVGQGSEFVVRLPLLLASMTPSPSAFIEPTNPNQAGCTVLVVDDNVDSAQSLAMLLEVSGHVVRVAYDGPTGLEAALADRPDVVLLDIGLPGLTGIEVAKRIRREPTLETSVLIAVTGYGQQEDRQRSRDAGFDHHLAKPADFAELQRILARVAEQAALRLR